MECIVAFVALAYSAFAVPAVDTHEGHEQAIQDSAGSAVGYVVTSTAAAVASIQASCTTRKEENIAAVSTSIPEGLVPNFGITPGVDDPLQAGSCLGVDNAAIPCFCPPPRDEFIERLNETVAAGNAFGIPARFLTHNSTASQEARKNAFIVTMQNFDNAGLGIGCPKAANTG